MIKIINKKNIMGLYPILVLLGFFLNHSNVIMGVNFSLADVFLILIVFLLCINKQLYIPVKQFLSFLLLSIVVLLVGNFVNVMLLNSSITGFNFIKEYIKLVVLFLYLVLGFNLSKSELIDILYQSFFVGSLVTASISILYFLFPIGVFRDSLFYGTYRFRGFMNDPNYYSILQITAIAYLVKSNKYSFFQRSFFIGIISLSILLSGSKTGLINLGIMSVILFINKNFLEKKSHLSILKGLLSISLLFLIVFIIVKSNLWLYIAHMNPSFERTFTIFNNFGSAISDGESGREMAWKQAINLIKVSPFFGIGIGTYQSLNYLYSGERTIAHNTYLQLMVEWGSLLSIIFFIVVGLSIVKTFRVKGNKMLELSRDLLLPFVLGSMSISLHNARLFWILLGAIFYYLKVNPNLSKEEL